MPSNGSLKVSIFMTTYNHSRFIGQAIEGVVTQETDFPIKLFVGEDCSTDETREICQRYKNQYPDKIELILREKNLGANANSPEIYEKCFSYGRYTAMCEGDDYWTDPLKLQKQIDFLEANSDFAVCFHRVKVVNEDGVKDSYLSNLDQREVTTFEDLAVSNYIHTPSCVFRNGLFGKFPEWVYQSHVGDWVLHLLNTQYGKIKFLEDTMAVYRIHKGGVWSTEEVIHKYQKWIEVVETCRNHFAPRGKESFARAYVASCLYLCFVCFNEGKYTEFRKYYFKCLEEIKYVGSRSLFALTVRYILSFMPFAANYYKVRENVKSAG